MSNKPYLLFDFDGTIANSIDLLFQIMNQMAPDFGIDPLSPEDFMVVRNMSAASIIRMTGIPLYKYPFIIAKVLKVYRSRVHELEPYPGIAALLAELRRRGIGFALLSSNSRPNVIKFLDRHKLHYFDWVEGTSGTLDKQNRIKKQIKKHRLDPVNLVYIGDESRDIEAAKACGIKVISVTWGFHPERLLLRYQPNYMVDRPDEILDIITDNENTASF